MDEFGRPTRKFWAFREVLAEFGDGPPPALPPAPPMLASPVRAQVARWAPLGEVMEVLGGAEAEGALPPTFEELGGGAGRGALPLRGGGAAAGVSAAAGGAAGYGGGPGGGRRGGGGAYGRGGHGGGVCGGTCRGLARVEVWVESLGRVNYGPRLGETKGLTGGLLHERQYVHGVRARGAAAGGAGGAGGRWRGCRGGRRAGRLPGRRGSTVRWYGWRVPGMRSWSCRAGCGASCGSTASVWAGTGTGGPQRSLYVPGPVLCEGENEVVVLEYERAGEPALPLG
ncbi:hypothetical protein GCM10020000_61040 [Streptomyces olivoverticillatus]